MKSKFYSFIFIGVLCISCGPNLPEDVAKAMQNLPSELDFNIYVKPILSDKCFACHGPDLNKQKANLRLDLPENAFARLVDSPGKVAIDPGHILNSEVFHRIMSEDQELIMPEPESNLSLSAYEKAVLIKWIQDGAEYKNHWAFDRPKKPLIPKVKNGKWVANPIDNFILKKLEREGLLPSEKASKEILLRRVSFDIIGLPPTIQEMDDFIADNTENAFEKVVDRLLASPHYGERMAVDWLDLARYADSHGYTVDRIRDMSPYRDWVIEAFNANMPYDQFMQWQLAGDLFPEPTKQMLIATAFNRNHPQNMEGGIIEKEFQTEYVIDRVNTFGQAFLGLSVGCARCHDHKYDPISQKNYYELYSFFNNVKEAGQISWNNATPTPTLLLPTKEQEQIIEFINSKIKNQENIMLELEKTSSSDFNYWFENESYKKLTTSSILKNGLIGKFSFDQLGLKNEVNSKEEAFLTRETNQKEIIEFVEGKSNKGIKMNGDSWLVCGGVGVFRKSDPFSIGLWVKLDDGMEEGVIFHKCDAERLYNYRGFHVYLNKDGSLEMSIAHTAPSDAINKTSISKVPKNKWIHLTMTYDGNSKASGAKLFLDGKELEMKTEMDQLKKDIIFHPGQNSKEPGLQIGAWWRGYGSKNGVFDDIVIYDRALSSFEVEMLSGNKRWEEIAAKKEAQISKTELTILKSYFYHNVLAKYKEEAKNLQDLRKTLADSTEFIEEIMVMQESKEPKQAYILNRGNYDDLGDEVFPNTPEKILKFPASLPKNRLGLAQWLTNVEHPLTSRVVVNRIWQNIFGVGLVKTSEDFGNQGEMPSNLDLLDYLAVSFQESEWDVKKLVKLMVMSSTYQQDSNPTPELRKRDPGNKLLARGPSFRLTAEMMRDNALFASSLLKPKIGGKSVKPYQPDGLWRISGATYSQDSGDELYRRSLYIIVKRTVPNPTLSTFDGLSRSNCEVRRQKTNTPLQALVTMNDPTYVEACKVIGEQMARNSNADIAIEETFRKLTGRKPFGSEKELLKEMQVAEYNKFKSDQTKMKGWLNAGSYQLDEELDQEMIAANAVVTNAILNSDACITKR